MMTAEQVMASNKAHITALLDLSSKAYAGVEKLVELNLATSRALLAETTQQTERLLNIKDAQELVSLQTSLFQPIGEKAVGYGFQVYDIAAAAGAEWGKAVEAQLTQAQQQFMDVVEKTAQNAPAGSEAAYALMKSAAAAVGNVVETVQKSAKQAATLAESNIKTAAETAMANTKASAKKR